MKLKSTCLFVTLLLAVASMATAADSPVSVAEVESAAPAPVTAPNDLASNCEAKAAPFFRAAFDVPPTNLTEICTQCSVPRCIGLPVGSFCRTASGQPGECHVYGLGGTSCESVGPDCECGIGVP
jgi:hypothetical protein